MHLDRDDRKGPSLRRTYYEPHEHSPDSLYVDSQKDALGRTDAMMFDNVDKILLWFQLLKREQYGEAKTAPPRPS